jgi:D-alanine-D-alanine ligase
MKKLRVLALVHEKLVPPDSLSGMTDAQINPVKMEYDVVTALGNLGHEVQVVALGDEVLPIRRAIEEFQPDVAFNMLAHFQNVGLYEAYVMSYVELLHVPYTGCNARGILLASDKSTSKKILSYHRVATPRFAVFRRGSRVRPPARLTYPLFVKSLDEHSSVGISQSSIVADAAGLRERVEFVHDYVGSDAIVEEYIPGRELTVGILGNQRLRALPVWEMTFDQLPEGSEPIATWKVKWDVKYQKKIGVRTGPARSLGEDEQRRIQHLARRIYRTLGLSGYARIDLRMTPEGRLYVLEANANPDLSLDEDFALAAEAAGIPYESLVQRVLNLAIRWTPPWREDDE